MASIQKRPDGRWRARYRDETGREHAKHFTRKVDAQRWLDEVTTAIVTGTYVDPKAGAITFSSFYHQWARRQVWAPGTRQAMDLAARSVTFSDLQLRQLRRSHIEQWVKVMSSAHGKRKRPLAPGTVHTRMNNVRAVLRGAVADRVIAVDPSEGVALPRRRRTAAAMTVPSPADVGKLLDVAASEFKAFVALGAFAGLRLGEAAGLQVGDVDFLRRQLAVSRQAQRENGGEVAIRRPKYGSERVVYLPAGIVTILSEHIAKHRPGDDPERWLFAGQRDDTPPHQNTIGHRWRRTLRAAGLRGMKLHDLRHYYASGLIAAGCDVVTVQRALGHATATTTLGTYAHLWPSAEDRTRAAAASMLAEAKPDLADYLRTNEAD